MRLTISGDPSSIGYTLRAIADADRPTDDGRQHERDRWFAEACLQLRDNGRKIQAIKMWRGYYGTGLMASKTAVESL